MAINVFDTPAEQPIINNYVPLPFQELLGAANVVEGRAAKLDEQLYKQKDLFKDLKYLHADDPYATQLQGELVKDVDEFYNKHQNLASPEAQREFYKIESKWRGDQRALNLQRNYENVTGALAQIKESREKGNQDYNLMNAEQAIKNWTESGGTYGQGLDKDPSLFNAGDITPYMKEEEIRNTVESSVNDMLASQSGYAQSDGRYIYSGTDKARGAVQLNAALEASKSQMLGGLAGENLANMYQHRYGIKDRNEALNRAWNEMKASIIQERVYGESDRHMTTDSYGTIGREYELNNPVVNLRRQDEGVEQTNPLGSTIQEITGNVQNNAGAAQSVVDQFKQMYREANGSEFTGSFETILNAANPQQYLGNLDPSLVSELKNRYEYHKNLEIQGKERWKSAVKPFVNELNKNKSAIEKEVTNQIFGGYKPVGNKDIDREVLENQEAYRNSHRVDSDISTSFDYGPKDPNKPYLKVQGDLLYRVDPITGAQREVKTWGRTGPVTNSSNVLTALGQSQPMKDLKDISSRIDKQLENQPKTQTSGWSQTAIPAFSDVVDEQGRVVGYKEDPESTAKMTGYAKKFFGNVANLQGLQLYGVGGKDPKDLTTVLQEELGIDPEDENYKESDVIMGDPRLSETPGLNGEHYFVVPISYKGKSVEKKVPISQINNEDVQRVANHPMNLANRTFEQGRAYQMDKVRPWPNQPIVYDYSSHDPSKVIQINGRWFSAEEGLKHIALNIENGYLTPQ